MFGKQSSDSLGFKMTTTRIGLSRRNALAIGVSTFLLGCQTSEAFLEPGHGGQSYRKIGIVAGNGRLKNFNERYGVQLYSPVSREHFIEVLTKLNLKWNEKERGEPPNLNRLPSPLYARDIVAQHELSSVIKATICPIPKRQHYEETFLGYVVSGNVVLIENYLHSLIPMP